MAAPSTTAAMSGGAARTRRGSRQTALTLAGAAVLAQIAYPLAGGRPLLVLTILAVLLFAAASLVHAATSHGWRAAARLAAVAAGLGLAAEIVGTATGFPFGRYEYSGTLGPMVAGVPLVIAAAWTMMAWPALLVGRRLAPSRRGLRRRAEVCLIGAWTLASWDLFLDPQMTAAGHWVFADPAPGLPGVPGIPLTNYAGWLLVSLVITTVLDLALPGHTADAAPRHEALPAVLLGWTWLGSTLANVAFFDRPVVALWGAIGMGLTVGPYLVRVVGSSRT